MSAVMESSAQKVIQCSDYLLITGDYTTDESFLHRLKSCCQQGYSLIILHLPKVSMDNYERIALFSLKVTQQYRCRLILHNAVDLARDLNADGVHLSGQLLAECQKRPVDKEKIFSASCHNSQELLQSERLGIDFATISPVMKTLSHPNQAPLGWDKFQDLAALTNVPVFALGGLDRTDLKNARQYGATGVAGIRAFWR